MKHFKTKQHPQKTSANSIYVNYKLCDYNTFIAYSQLNCHYCGVKPFKLFNGFMRWPHRDSYKKANFYYNGIDRVDSNKSYSLDNIVPACNYCNSGKNNLSYSEFINHLIQLHDNKPNRKLMKNNLNEIESHKLRIARRNWNAYYKDIEFKNFLHLSQYNCYYCNREPSNQSKTRKGDYFIYNGLDRIDNSKLHSLDNVVPCCKYCNAGKLTKSIEEFDKWIDLSYSHIINNKLNSTSINEFIKSYNDYFSNFEISFPLKEIK